MRRIEFHQARITVTARIVDEARSYGVQQFELTVLLNTDTEWAVARERISKAMTQLTEGLHDADSD